MGMVAKEPMAGLVVDRGTRWNVFGGWLAVGLCAAGLLSLAPRAEAEAAPPVGFGERAVATENRESSKEAMNL